MRKQLSIVCELSSIAAFFRFLSRRFLLSVTLLLRGCTTVQVSEVTLQGHTMGTHYLIKLNHSMRQSEITALDNEIKARLMGIERDLSTYDFESTISKFNQAQTTDWFRVSEDLELMARYAGSICEKSNGVYDITVLPLVNLWGFGPQSMQHRIPSKTEIDGQTYSHIIHPKTGWPINHALMSVSVISSTCMEADAWATALLVLGEKEGYELAQKMKIAAFFVIKNDGAESVITTPEFNKFQSREAN